MSSFLEFEGKKVELAIQKACKQLKINEEKINYEVVSYGSTGIFGLVGAKKARIRVEVAGDTVASASEKQASGIKPQTPGTESEVAEKENLNELEEIGPFGKTVVEKILAAISPESTVLMELKKNGLLYKINGGNSGVIIGKRGQTLDAVQYIVEKIINKKCTERVRIQIDVEGYLENRKDNLQALAGKLAEKVKKNRQTCHRGTHDCQ